MQTISQANLAATAPRQGPVAPGRFSVCLDGYLRHQQLDIDGARREAGRYQHMGRKVQVVKVTETGLLDCGFSGWNWKPLAGEVAA